MAMTNKEQLAYAKRFINSRCPEAKQYCNLPDGASYCDAFVTFIYYKGGNKMLYCDGRKETYCPHSIEWCRAHLAQIPIYLTMECDIVFFDWDGNGRPNHVGMSEKAKSTTEIRTIEGNTSGGIVDEKNRTAIYVQGPFRPHFVPAKINVAKPLTIDGKFGYNSIAMLQKALGIKVDGILGKATVKALQTKAGTTPDGCWGKGTSRKVQKMIGATADGDFGPASVKKLQQWCNAQVFKEEPTRTVSEEPAPEPTKIDPPKKKKTKAEKIIEKIDEYAWPNKTPKKKWQYKTGHAKKAYKEALHKAMHKTAKISQSDCGYFVSTPIRILGIDKNFDCLNGYDWDYSKALKVVHNGGKIKKGELKPGDIIRYGKYGGGQHTMVKYSKNKIAEAQRGHAFPKIKKDRKKYNRRNVKKKTIQVLRVKE